MRSTLVPCIVLILTAGLPPSASAVSIDDPLDPETARVNWRWIGVRANVMAPCPLPQPSTWIARPLFPATTSPALAPFCLYESPGVPDPTQLQPLLTGGALLALGRDAMVVGRQGSTLETALWPTLSQHFREQAGAPVPGAIWPLPTTRLAVLDTGPTNDRNPETASLSNSSHGFSLVNMARSFLCTGSACAAEVVTRLAMPYVDFDPSYNNGLWRDDLEGGLFGTLGELAEAIETEVKAWHVSPQQNLILNLSLGWHPRFGGGVTWTPTLGPPTDPDELPIFVVYQALRVAVCEGALVVAAAGNSSSEREPSNGMLLPAGWERFAAPDSATCAALIGGPPDPTLFTGGGYRPLLFAASGLRQDDQPLFNHRLGAEARITVFSDHAVTEAAAGTHTSILTGSSVSALMTSTTAAAIWSYRPGLNPFEVMDAIYADGDDLGRTADVFESSLTSAPKVHRIRYCPAVVAACAEGACSDPLPTCATAAPAALDLSAALGGFTPTKNLRYEDFVFEWSPVECMGDVIRFPATSSPPTDPCPHWQYYNSVDEPYTDPQPEEHPCPACEIGYASPGVLAFELDDDFGGTVTDIALRIGHEVLHLDIVPSERVMLTGIPEAFKGAKMSLVFTLGGGKAVVAPLLFVDSPPASVGE